jgi:hypothetical protein
MEPIPANSVVYILDLFFLIANFIAFVLLYIFLFSAIYLFASGLCLLLIVGRFLRYVMLCLNTHVSAKTVSIVR